MALIWLGHFLLRRLGVVRLNTRITAMYGTKSQIYNNAFAMTGWRHRKPVGDP